LSPNAWIQTIADYTAWRVIKISDIIPVIDILPPNIQKEIEALAPWVEKVKLSDISQDDIVIVEKVKPSDISQDDIVIVYAIFLCLKCYIHTLYHHLVSWVQWVSGKAL